MKENRFNTIACHRATIPSYAVARLMRNYRQPSIWEELIELFHGLFSGGH
jgi:hypothetical protein